MRTLFLRVHRASETALAIATHFDGHPALSAVLYPGLPSHPGHQIAARQMDGGFGGMLSVRLAGRDGHARAVLRAVRVFKRATSLGGVESLIEHRRSMEGPSSPVPGDLLRLSVGIEAPGDLVADLETALDGALRSTPVPPAPGGTSGSSPAMDLTARVTAALERSILPTVIARGAAVRVAAAGDGVVTLEVTGSPGAVFPLASRIEALIRAAVPEITTVRLVTPGARTAGSPPPTAGGLAEAARRILDAEINPAIAAHRGHVAVAGAGDGGDLASASKADARAAAWRK